MPELLKTEIPGLPAPKVGKVREVYDLEPSTGRKELLIVATDRISAFDATMANGIPEKGAILTRMSAWWMEHLLSPAEHHLISTDAEEIAARVPGAHPELAGRATVAKKARPFPVECVARGALAGSLYKEYREADGFERGAKIHGFDFGPGILESQLLDEPIFTPATKAEAGHDENISLDRMADLVGEEATRVMKECTLALYAAAAKRAKEGGLILADTKFEFGEDEDGILLIDEALTPDSSRYWDAERYAPGGSPASFDKQYVRDFLESVGWNKLPPGPALPEDVREGTRRRYEEAYRRIVGRDFVATRVGSS